MEQYSKVELLFMSTLDAIVAKNVICNVGMTGTRYGCQNAQMHTLTEVIYQLGSRGIDTWHHGDCIGADSQFHHTVKALRNDYKWKGKIIIHPPLINIKNDDDNWAKNQGDENREPLSHLARNRKIVEEVDLLLATTYDMFEQKTGGTWYTVNYARKQGKPVMIIWPDGSVN